MAKGYWVTTYQSISDQEKLAKYAKLAGPAIEAAGGRFLARGGQVTAYEAGKAERTVVIEFDSYAQAIAAYQSKSYQQALAVLDGAVVRDLRIIQGVD